MPALGFECVQMADRCDLQHRTPSSPSIGEVLGPFQGAHHVHSLWRDPVCILPDVCERQVLG